jgi:serine/threonine protein kinase
VDGDCEPGRLHGGTAQNPPLRHLAAGTFMSMPSLSAFVEAVRRSGWLAREQVDQFAALAGASDADPLTVAKEVVRRGWLTALQVRMFWNGRGHELFLGQYVLLEKLGEGGMGEVYKARQRRLERDVALKVIRRERLDNPAAVSRFRREVQAIAALAHPNVVRAYDADEAGGVHFYAMEFIEGTNLARLVREQGPLPVAEACDCVRQSALGLQHAHERGLVHRDIKPSNVLLGNNGVVKLLDLGLARLHDVAGAEQHTRLTHEGLVIGTPDFIAPEQARNSHGADIRADLYALGCTFFYLLTGQAPYPGGTPTERLVKHSVEPIPDVRELRADVPVGIAAIIQKLLAKRPEDRFQEPAELADLLEPYCPRQSAHARLPKLPAAPTPVEEPILSGPLPEVPLAEAATDSRFQLPSGLVPMTGLAPSAGKFRRHLISAVVIGAMALAAIGAGIVWAVSRSK